MDVGQDVTLSASTLLEFLQNGLAIEPILMKDVGEITRVIHSGGERIVHCSSQQFIRKLCQYLFLDIKSLQNRVKEKLHKTQLLPIPLSFQFVLFPLRTPNMKDVKTRGFLWVSYRHVNKVQSSTNGHYAEICLVNGHKILVPYSRSFVLQQLRDAQLIDFLFQEVHFTVQRYGQRMTGNALSEELLYLAEAIRKYKP